MARVLLVEDEALVSALAEQWLLDLGHDVVGPAADLASALKLADQSIDGALVDVSLGRQTAYPLAEVLAARGIPFVLATGYGPEAIEPAWRDRPMLAKPFEFDDFQGAVERLLTPSD